MPAQVVGEERHHILNSEYVVRQADGSAATTKVADEQQLLGLLASVFGLELPAGIAGVDRYLEPHPSI